MTRTLEVLFYARGAILLFLLSVVVQGFISLFLYKTDYLMPPGKQVIFSHRRASVKIGQSLDCLNPPPANILPWSTVHVCVLPLICSQPWAHLKVITSPPLRCRITISHTWGYSHSPNRNCMAWQYNGKAWGTVLKGKTHYSHPRLQCYIVPFPLSVCVVCAHMYLYMHRYRWGLICCILGLCVVPPPQITLEDRIFRSGGAGVRIHSWVPEGPINV